MRNIVQKTLLVFLVSGLINLFAQPQPPTNLTGQVVYPSTNSVKVLLTWQDSIPPNTLIRFNIYRKDSDTGSFHKIATNITQKSFYDPNVQFNRTYSYKVTAFNNQGESQPSNIVTLTITPPVPIVKATITGQVFNEATNAPIHRANIKFFFNNVSGTVCVMSDSFGNFKVKLNPGQYYIYTNAHGYIPEYYDNVQNLQQATLITLASSDSINISISLAQTIPPVQYTLSGSVKDPVGNVLRAKIKIYKSRLNSHFYPYKEVRTDSLGNFTVQTKQGDTLIVYASPILIQDWYPEFYNDKRNINEADRIAINGNITGINFILEHKPVYPNGIAGTVKDTLDDPVLALIHAFPKYVNTHPIITTTMRRYLTHSDSLGVYAFTNMLPGKYVLFAHPEPGYLPTYFRYDGTPTMNWRNADSVMVDSTSLVQNINFIVHARPDSGFASITGIVKDRNNSVIEGAVVLAIDQNNEVYSFAISNKNGQYNLCGLVPGDYVVVSDKEGYQISSNQYAQVSYPGNTSSTFNFVLNPYNVTSVDDQVSAPENFSLSQNYPNPFNPSTVISFQIPSDAKVTLKIYNVLGNEVATLVNEYKAAGKYDIKFNASELSSGVYFYKLEAGNFSATKKLTLMK